MSLNVLLRVLLRFFCSKKKKKKGRFIPIINGRHTNIIEIATKRKNADRSANYFYLLRKGSRMKTGYRSIYPVKIWNERFNDCRKIERKKIDSKGEGIAANCWKAVFLPTISSYDEREDKWKKTLITRGPLKMNLTRSGYLGARSVKEGKRRGPLLLASTPRNREGESISRWEHYHVGVFAK